MPSLDGSLHPTTSYTTVGSPIGDLTVVVRESEVVGLYFPHHWTRPDPSSFGRQDETGADEVGGQLREYFAGHRRSFDLPLCAGGTGFQRRVWALIGQLPYGETTTYGHLALQVDDGSTPQEVGAAVGQNPLSILVPCHRVVGASGKLVGYAGGLQRKQFLLDLERDVVEQPGRLF
jgi:methylated-DNA-[protein]-cysteine S-methyltransferase